MTDSVDPIPGQNEPSDLPGTTASGNAGGSATSGAARLALYALADDINAELSSSDYISRAAGQRWFTKISALLLEPQEAREAAPSPRADGVVLIAGERQRQVSAEGWTPEHDDTHRHGELAFTAARYALHDVGVGVDPSDLAQAKIALAAAGRWDSCWWKPKDPVRNLVRAGALIAAEIDRLQRAIGEPPAAPEPAAQPLASQEARDAAPSPRAEGSTQPPGLPVPSPASDAEVIAAIRGELWDALRGREIGGDRTLLGMVKRLRAERDEARDNRRGEFELRIIAETALAAERQKHGAPPEGTEPAAQREGAAQGPPPQTHQTLAHDNQVSPHEFDRAGWRWWICRHCYAPKPLHPRREWVKARPLGDTTYLSKDAPHFKEGW